MMLEWVWQPNWVVVYDVAHKVSQFCDGWRGENVGSYVMSCVIRTFFHPPLFTAAPGCFAFNFSTPSPNY